MIFGLEVHDPRRPIGPDDLWEGGEPQAPARHTVPRIARFLATDGAPHIGLVLTSREGLPRRLLDLTSRHGLGPGLLEFVAAGGLEVAERELEKGAGAQADEAGADHVVLEEGDLPRRLLSPVDIDGEQLERSERLVVGFGLTFRTHRRETGRGRPIVFPKPTVPTGACTPVVTGEAGERGGGALLDYELELGVVPFRDVDLGRLDRVEPATDFGYLVVNDVTAREAILRDRRGGFTSAKSRPTYLPCGPWLVPGTHFTRDEPRLRRMVLTVTEGEGRQGADEGGGAGRHSLRQNARLEELTLGLRELLALLARRRTLTMAGPDGRQWPVTVERKGRRILPAGSLLLTGTPGGTAIRAPAITDRLALVARSLRYWRWPSETYRRHLAAHRHVFGFLSPGDRVSGWITGLGRQSWEVH